MRYSRHRALTTTPGTEAVDTTGGGTKGIDGGTLAFADSVVTFDDSFDEVGLDVTEELRNWLVQPRAVVGRSEALKDAGALRILGRRRLRRLLQPEASPIVVESSAPERGYSTAQITL